MIFVISENDKDRACPQVGFIPCNLPGSAMEVLAKKDLKCFHCGDACDANPLFYRDKSFCCQGCEMVYKILSENELDNYYNLESFPGTRQSLFSDKFAYLDNDAIATPLLSYASEKLHKVQLLIPNIHCSSCIWLLEHVSRLHQGVLGSRVNFTKKELSVDYHPENISLRGLVELLTRIGYEPNISLADRETKKNSASQSPLTKKIAVAGFCFGNIMLLSFPEYLGLDFGVDQILAWWFSWLMLILALPVLFYCSSDYFKSAFKGLRERYLNIDVPIVLGILALFGQSFYEIVWAQGAGYLDSLAGLLFLLLVGKWFQARTYRNLSFDRDFKSYFPLAVLRLRSGTEESVLVSNLRVDDVLLIRHQELIPADSVLLDAHTQIDYSFVTGESQPVIKEQGATIYAGGKHLGVMTKYQVIKPMSQSYITQLWNHQAFHQKKENLRVRLVNNVSKYFTVVILLIALLAAASWLVMDPKQALFVFTSVLIVACPCALSMATPFTLGSVMRVFSRNKFYLRDAEVVEGMAKVDTLLFDKTGTLTKPKGFMQYQGDVLTSQQVGWIVTLVSQSSHPVSQDILKHLNGKYPKTTQQAGITEFKEVVGQGVSATLAHQSIKIGSPQFVGLESNASLQNLVYVSVNERIIGHFEKISQYRNGLKSLFQSLKDRYQLGVLSGDGDAEKQHLSQTFAVGQLNFNQDPQDKLQHVKNLQNQQLNVMMIGDGLNDAGALKQSNVGIAITENTNHFSPASDGIMAGSALPRLGAFLRLSKAARRIIIWGFALSFLYNVVGLSLAVTAHLTPLTAAILMPISSISVVFTTTMAVNFMAKNMKL